MTVIIGSDHGGHDLRRDLLTHLRARGLPVRDIGPADDAIVDFPDVAAQLTTALLRSEEGSRGILICGSGVGVSIAANKVRGIRAALAHDHYSAHQSVEHDDANVLCLGGRVVGTQVARELVDAFLGATYQGGSDFERRLRKVIALESGHGERER